MVFVSINCLISSKLNIKWLVYVILRLCFAPILLVVRPILSSCKYGHFMSNGQTLCSHSFRFAWNNLHQVISMESSENQNFGRIHSAINGTWSTVKMEKLNLLKSSAWFHLSAFRLKYEKNGIWPQMIALFLTIFVKMGIWHFWVV